jgi:hypothetical protein
MKAFPERDSHRLLAQVFVGAVLFRIALGVSGLVEVVYDTYDSWEYRDLAWSMLNHAVFGLDGVPKMNRTPGYPAFLAMVFSLLGASRLAVSAAQVALDALTCVMVVHIALALRLRRSAVATVAVLSIACLYTAIYSMMMMTEVVYAFLITAAVWALATSPKSSPDGFFGATTGRVMLTAASLGCGILVRPALAPPTALFGAMVLVAGVLHGSGKVSNISYRALWQPVAFGAVLVLIVAPWMLRNYVVFHYEFVKPAHDQVTLLGYKTDIVTFRHWYTKEMMGYLYSNEEPFVMTKAYRVPEVVRYVYPEEQADLARVFANLETELFAGSQPIERATLQELVRITENRYRAAPRLHVTAPVSRALRVWVTPRISSFWLDTSGHNSSLAMTAGFTAYDLMYVVPGTIGIVWGLYRIAPIVFLYVLAMMAGHTWMYAVWLPNPQSRYAIPLFPLVALGAGMFVHQMSGRQTARQRGDFVPASTPGQ